ncbi:MAG: hypothetical protein P8Y70_04760 [Candidatus Lokiarchaeota archaeon]
MSKKVIKKVKCRRWDFQDVANRYNFMSPRPLDSIRLTQFFQRDYESSAYSTRKQTITFI